MPMSMSMPLLGIRENLYLGRTVEGRVMFKHIDRHIILYYIDNRTLDFNARSLVQGLNTWLGLVLGLVPKF